MKTPQKLLLAFAFSTLLAGAASAQIASDNAGNAAYSGGWNTGSNGGSGFGAWALTGSNGTSGFFGNYVGETGQGNPSFGIYSGGDASASSTAARPFLNPLTAGQSFSVSVGRTNNTTQGELGIQLWNSGNTTTPAVNLKSVNGGNWQIWDGGTEFDSGAAFAANAPLTFTFNYLGGSDYSYSFGSSATTRTATNTISAINQVSFYNNNQGASQNYGFNNLSVVPEPSTYALIALGAAFVLWRVRRRVTSGV